MPLEPLGPGDPALVGPHRLLGRLGRGGMGTVYLALSPEDRAVAVKVLRDGPSDLDGRRRFRRELELLQRVRGPHLVEVLGGDADAQTPWLVTRFVPGRRLDELVDAAGPLDEPALLRVALGVVRGLAALHAAGVVHRDLTPGNVLLVDGEPHIIDLGLAFVADVTQLTRSGLVVGTAGYLAPEQVIGTGCGTAADVHAWGATIALAGTGRPPYGTGRADAVLYRVVHSEPDLVGLPDSLAPLVAAALAKDASARPSVAELVAACAALASRRRDLVGVSSGPHSVPAELRGGGVPPAVVPAASRPELTEVLAWAVRDATARPGAGPEADEPTTVLRLDAAGDATSVLRAVPAEDATAVLRVVPAEDATAVLRVVPAEDATAVLRVAGAARQETTVLRPEAPARPDTTVRRPTPPGEDQTSVLPLDRAPVPPAPPAPSAPAPFPPPSGPRYGPSLQARPQPQSPGQHQRLLPRPVPPGAQPDIWAGPQPAPPAAGTGHEPGSRPRVVLPPALVVPALLVLGAAAVLAPVLTVAGALVGVVLLQVVALSAAALRRTVERRGPKRRDPFVLLLGAPKRVLRASVQLLLGAPVLAVGAALPAYAVMLSVEGPGRSAVGAAVGTVLGVLLTLARRPFGPARDALGRIGGRVTGRPDRGLPWVAGLLVLATVLAAAASSGAHWWPGTEPTSTCVPQLFC